MNSRYATVLAILLSSFATLLSASARASTVCTPTSVSIDNVTLAIKCSQDDWHFSSPSASADAKKAWLSMAELALLSGKSLQMEDVSGIVWLELDK